MRAGIRAVLLLCGLLGGHIVAWAGFAPPAAAGPQAFNIAGIEVAAWLPESSVPGPWPVLVYSHGFNGCNTQTGFLMEALAASGYAIFAPNHRDAACAVMMWPTRPQPPFGEVSEWNETTLRDRRDDIERLLNALARDPRYAAPPFDWQNVGLIGYSLGGYTALGLAGAWETWKDPRVKAVLGLSPFAAPFVARETLRNLSAPVMYQGGTRDTGATPSLKEPGGAFDQSPAPKYFVEFENAGHFAWTDRNVTMQEPVVAYSRAFLDRYLKGKPFPAALAAPHPGVTDVRIAE
ncbi:MAG TPA: dienelactone hydrolase family protein [Alphaproteobacteria bacterium]|jgi:predicted dienelactone hydrolase|nr:dienelactone hydrolase family protein [Alphaproteobacteria bacterium]